MGRDFRLVYGIWTKQINYEDTFPTIWQTWRATKYLRPLTSPHAYQHPSSAMDHLTISSKPDASNFPTLETNSFAERIKCQHWQADSLPLGRQESPPHCSKDEARLTQCLQSSFPQVCWFLLCVSAFLFLPVVFSIHLWLPVLQTLLKCQSRWLASPQVFQA